jgi:hypothetical protein
MVQYLYAAYSLDPDSATGDEREKVRLWQQQILEIAREEMGHLVTVQNLLRVIGGPLSFARQEVPYQSDFYPFPFELKPLSKNSLAKFIVAEMPESSDNPELKEIKKLAMEGNAGKPVNRVGRLYEAIAKLFEKLDESDFQASSVAYQADFDTWGRDYARAPRGATAPAAAVPRQAPELIVRPVYSKTTALAALKAVAEQGEGILTDDSEFSHFQRFVAIFRGFQHGGERYVRNIATNPVTMEVTTEPDEPPVTVIKDPKSLLWGQLFNTRYRLLLSLLSHALHAPGPLASVTGPSPRGRLVAGAFGEMYQLRALAEIMVRQPVGDPSKTLSGPPFELPYSLTLSDLPAGRWKAHRDILMEADFLIERLREQKAGETSYLEGLQFQNKTFLEQIEAILRTLDLPVGIV